jgi:hypothetical protein
MATILESGPLGSLLGIVFVFVLVFAVSYALLKKIKLFGPNDGVHSIVAFIFAAFTVMIPESQIILSNFLPWVLLFFMLIMAIFMFFMFIGVKEDDMVANVAKSTGFITIVIATVIVLFLVAMTKAYGPWLMVNGGTSFWATTKRFIFSRYFLGLIFMLFVGAYAISYLAGSDDKK